MFAKQPKEGTAGLTDAQLLSLIKGVPRIAKTDSIARCISDKTYVPWVVGATQRALDGPIAGSSIGKVPGTPTVLVNGQEYKATTPFTTAEFSNFVVTAAGNSYSDTATSSATPASTPTPTKK
jgi:hypothetical protein